MTFNNSTIIIIIVVAFAFYLIYSQNNQAKYMAAPNSDLQKSWLINHILNQLAKVVNSINIY